MLWVYGIFIVPCWKTLWSLIHPKCPCYLKLGLFYLLTMQQIDTGLRVKGEEVLTGHKTISIRISQVWYVLTGWSMGKYFTYFVLWPDWHCYIRFLQAMYR